MDLALAGSTQPSAIDEALGRRVRAHWDDGEIVELMGVIALFGFLNRWNDGMGTSLEQEAQVAAGRTLKAQGWTRGKHVVNEVE